MWITPSRIGANSSISRGKMGDEPDLFARIWTLDRPVSLRKRVMDQRSFKEILLEKLDGTERFHSQNPVDLDPAGLSYLLGQVEKYSFGQTFGTQSHYKRPAPRPKYKLAAPRPKGPAHDLNESQKAAYGFFTTNGSPLLEDFTLAELKTGFRSLAFKLHPDHGGTAAHFIELKRSFELLSEVVA